MKDIRFVYTTSKKEVKQRFLETTKLFCEKLIQEFQTRKYQNDYPYTRFGISESRILFRSGFVPCDINDKRAGTVGTLKVLPDGQILFFTQNRKETEEYLEALIENFKTACPNIKIVRYPKLSNQTFQNGIRRTNFVGSVPAVAFRSAEKVTVWERENEDGQLDATKISFPIVFQHAEKQPGLLDIVIQIDPITNTREFRRKNKITIKDIYAELADYIPGLSKMEVETINSLVPLAIHRISYGEVVLGNKFRKAFNDYLDIIPAGKKLNNPLRDAFSPPLRTITHMNNTFRSSILRSNGVQVDSNGNYVINIVPGPDTIESITLDF